MNVYQKLNKWIDKGEEIDQDNGYTNLGAVRALLVVVLLVALFVGVIILAVQVTPLFLLVLAHPLAHLINYAMNGPKKV